MNDGWRYVVGSKNKSVKCDVSNWGNAPNYKFFLKRNELVELESASMNVGKVVESIECLVSTIECTEFYSCLRRVLRNYTCKRVKMILLGCASPTRGPFVTNCKYQWALSKLLAVDASISLKILATEIFDPIMSNSDYKIWQKLIRVPETASETDLLLLIMPHCEVELYHTVLESASHKLDIVESAKKLANGNYQYRDIAKLSGVILVSNSLESCTGMRLNNQVTEVKLPNFDPYPNAFNNLYLSIFSA